MTLKQILVLINQIVDESDPHKKKVLMEELRRSLEQDEPANDRTTGEAA